MFDGGLTVTPPLTELEKSYLDDFAKTRHTSPDHGPLATVSRLGTRQPAGNTPQADMPGVWCDWVADDDGNLVWNNAEKTYNHGAWIAWLIDHLLSPAAREFVSAHLEDDPRLNAFCCDHTINGIVNACGEDANDIWRIVVRDNIVTIQRPQFVWPD